MTGPRRFVLKAARLRPLAEEDLVDATRHYAHEGGAVLGERVFDAALAALQPIQRMPTIGSPQLGLLCEVPGLRSWRVKGFPMQWLYFEAKDHLDVVRLLGDRQDIMAILSQED
ncbi:MAG: type II toxin-antitoxin system RelE/ParE family toxin [Rhizobacter sp.]